MFAISHQRALRAVGIAAAALALMVGVDVYAQERQSPLEGQPAVRQRLLLRKFRFELTPMVGFGLLGEYSTSVLPGAKVAFHFNDWIAIQGFGLFGVGVESGLTGQIQDAYTRNNGPMVMNKCMGNQFLNCVPITDPASSVAGSMDPAQFKNRLAKVNGHFGAGAQLSPFFGKMALFGRVFFQYDLYALAGIGIVNYTNSFNGIGQDPDNAGVRVGANVGAGLHLFVNNWLAINFEYRATIVKNNMSGGDNNGDFVVNGDDASVRAEQMAVVGVSFYFPTRVAVSP